ncbi:class I adenylate-forming enzyme family protein [Propylenella binzhouense]|uniref:3-methylmercaptopropionyl-CoA ligase n=1 Tax=Propylenella binzhouense TaxID=2555902 RepID=A0A964T1X3_9HYPH|nr:class I adenylate-forming enzyme family protein [Propylenella binzhouense]MYZ46891.1 long-chain fatty acid--CoA ligase [Propylenella binzhouense]
MNPPFSRTYPDLLRENAACRGDAPAAICGDRTVTYAELAARAASVCARLRRLGIRRGARVGMIMSNRIEWLEICFGASMAGAVVVPFSTWSTRKELEFLLPDSRVEVLFSLARFGDRDFLSDLTEIDVGDIDVVIVGATGGLPDGFGDFASFSEEVASHDLLPPGEGPTADDDALVLYTSGSTSAPKAVRLKQHGVVENGFNIGERQGLRPSDRVLLSAPLFWSYGGANALPAAFTHGACLVLLEKFDPAAALDAIERLGCTAIYTLPAMTSAMVRQEGFNLKRTASLRTGLTIGSPQEFMVAVEKLGVPELCNIYGATETYGNCAVTWHYWPVARRAACQGFPLPGQEFRFRDEETGELVAPGQPGLLEVRGYITPGYSGKSAELNAKVFTDDGFYCTGDLGRLDADGAFVFVGRSTEMIKRAGINVSPAEIEEVLLQHDKVARAAVIGVPDMERGEVIVAFVVENPGAGVSPEELVRHLKGQLSKYKIPDRIEICDALPLTPTGKLHRKQLKASAIALAGGKAEASS